MNLLCRTMVTLSALLLITVIACNDPGSGSSGKSKQQNVEVQDVTLETIPATRDSKALSPPPPDANQLEEVKIGTINEEGIKDEAIVAPPVEDAAKEKVFNTEDYDHIVENKFLAAIQNPLSTFSIDVDKAAYSNVRRFIQNGSLPPAGAVRIEEIKLRYKKPAEDISQLISCPVMDAHTALAKTSDNFRFSAAVASFGMLLRNSEYRQASSYQQVLALAGAAKGADAHGYRQEFVSLVTTAGSLQR